MNKKRIASFFTAVCLILIFTFNCFAALGTADPDKPDEGVSYADTVNEGAVAVTDPPYDLMYEHGLSSEKAKFVNTLIEYWNNYGLLTILIVLAVIVVIALVVSVSEKKKLNKIKKNLPGDK
ncbi:MAG: hypothetical protein IJB86_02390 [Clostridia bacterium]|nr:hypothetical protein [Clostridia bacterium]